MKLSDLMEMPITHFGRIGDFDDEQSMRHASDRLAVTAEPVIQRIKTAWEKTPFKFRLYFANIAEGQDYIEYGVASKRLLQRLFPDHADEIQANRYHRDENGSSTWEDVQNGSITIIFTNNEGDDRRSFTPWIIAHRVSHAWTRLSEPGQPRYGGQNDPMYQASSLLINTGRSILRDFALDTTEENLRLLYEHIGTMKSARSKSLPRPNEFFHELFAQYLLQGTINFNPIDGTTFNSVDVIFDYDTIQKTNVALEKLKSKLITAFSEGLQEAVGRVWIM